MESKSISCFLQEQKKNGKRLFLLVSTIASFLVLFLMEGETQVKQNEVRNLENTITRLITVSNSEDNKCEILSKDITIVTTILNNVTNGTLKLLNESLNKIKNAKLLYIEEKIRQFTYDETNSRDKSLKIKVFNKSESWVNNVLPLIKNTLMTHNYDDKYKQTAYESIIAESLVKYEILFKAIQENPFCTKHFSWISPTFLQKNQQTQLPSFTIRRPNDSDTSRIAFCQVYDMKKLSEEDIIHNQKPWLSEDIIIGTDTAITNLSQQVLKSAARYLHEGLIGTSSSIIYAMYAHSNDASVLLPKLEIYYDNHTSESNAFSCSQHFGSLIDS